MEEYFRAKRNRDRRMKYLKYLGYVVKGFSKVVKNVGLLYVVSYELKMKT